MLKRNGRNVRRIRRKQDFAGRDSRPNSEGNPFMKERKEIRVRVYENERKCMPQIEAERLVRIHLQKFVPCGGVRDAEPITEVRHKRLNVRIRQRRIFRRGVEASYQAIEQARL